MESGKVTNEVLAKAAELINKGQISYEVIDHIKKRLMRPFYHPQKNWDHS